MRRALGFEAYEHVDTPQLNDINWMAFSRRYRSKQTFNDRKWVEKRFQTIIYIIINLKGT
jgi:hypothetical protein